MTSPSTDPQQTLEAFYESRYGHLTAPSNAECMELIHKALLVAARTTPYFIPVLYKLKFTIDDSVVWNISEKVAVPTFAVDERFRCYVHPLCLAHLVDVDTAQTASCPRCGKVHTKYSSIAGVILHEAMHPLMRHAKRTQKFATRDKFYPKLWNIAADMEFNPGIAHSCKNASTRSAALACLPGDAVHPSFHQLPPDLLAEEYYDLLLKLAKPPTPSADHGSGADGQARSWDKGGSSGAVGDPEDGVSETERALLERKVAENIRQANQKKPGTIAGGMVRWADGVIEPPKVRWQDQLRRVCLLYSTNIRDGSSQRTFKRPGIASLVQNCRIITPSYNRPVPKVVMVRDTSGSMYGEATVAAIRECEGIVKASKCPVHLIDVDTEATAARKVKTMKSVAIEGGGGTDMRVGLEAAAEMKPDLVVLITDGYTPFHDTKPFKAPLIICVVGTGQPIDSAFPSYAQVIRVEE